MKRKHPLWFLLPLALLLPLAACSSQEPDTATQENTIAPYALTDQEQSLLYAFGLTEEKAQVFSFQAPAEATAIFLQVSRLGEDGTWENTADSVAGIAIGEDQEGPFSGLLGLEEESDRSISLHLQTNLGNLATPPQGAAPDLAWTMRSSVFLEDPQTIQLDQPIPVALLAYDSGTSMSSLNLQDYFTPENLTGPDLVQAVTVTFSETA